MRKKTVFASVFTSAVLILSPGVAFADLPSNIDSVTGIQLSSTISSTPSLTGSVQSSTGQSVANARVELIAWPSGEFLGNMAIDAEVPILVAAVDRTAANGTYKLTPTNPALWQYADVDGKVNFEVAVYADGYQASTMIPSIPVLSNPNARAAAVGVSASVDTLTLEAAAGVVTNSTGLEPAAGVTPAIVPCRWRKTATAGVRYVEVGEAYTTTGVTATFTYSEQASTNVTIGVKLSSPSANWTPTGGTVSVSSDDGIEFSQAGANVKRKWRTGYVFDYFRHMCTGKQNLRATSFAGGSSSLTPATAPTATYCVNYEAGDKPFKKSTRASSFSSGAATSGAIGINLSAQTGFSSQSWIQYSFSSSKKLCGAIGYPGGTPGRLVAKP